MADICEPVRRRSSQQTSMDRGADAKLNTSPITGMCGDGSWQSVLDNLTTKAKKEGLLRSVKNANSFEGKLRKIMDSIAIRGKLSAWISKCAESHYSKSGGTATRLRDEGNLKFRAHDNEGSLKLFTESVICAPEFGPELSLAYGNRSACLYHLNHYNDCLQDIRLALRFRYPKNLEYKLHQRSGQCFMKTGRPEEADKSFGDAIAALDLVPKLEKKKKSLIRDIEALMKESRSVSEANHKGKKHDAYEPVAPAHGTNPDLEGASKILGVKTSAKKGRHVVTNKAVEVGDVLFSELPFSSVLLPEHYSTHCHHCYNTFVAPIPCIRCTQPRYCSERCRQESWDAYHQYECTGLDLLHSAGIASLGLRTLLCCGVERLVSYRAEMQQKNKGSERDPSGWLVAKRPSDESRYIDVYNLVTHLDECNQEDLFQYAVTALLLTTYLERRTTFFDSQAITIDGLKIGSGGGQPPVRRRSSSDVDSVDESLLVFVGGILFRHILQLVCNASAIYEVGPAHGSDIEEETGPAVVTTTQFRIATAIYPSASMMNHSCCPSVINSFLGARLIVRAIKNVPEGEEILNCYGPHFRRHSLAERQEQLLSQYHFVCRCVPCRNKEWEDFRERFSALKCQFCGGPIRNPHSESSLEHQMPCIDCGRSQGYSDQIRQVFLAYDLFQKGMNCLKFGNMVDALPALQSCYQLRLKAMYAHHLEVTEVADQLARCYAMMGSFSESAQYLKVCIPAIQERFGMHSVEVGHELLKYSDVLLGDLQDTTKRISLFEEKLLESRQCLERAAQIFEMHYGKWNRTYQEILQKLEKTKFLVENQPGP